MAPSPLLSVGVVGASGVVGKEFLKILEQRRFPVEEIRLFGGKKSDGSTITFRGKDHQMQQLFDGCFKGLDLVFFSAGNDISKEWAPKAVKERAFAIDNSSAFRMHPEVQLIVPEVNGHLLPKGSNPNIIANPNCSTIQLVVVLKPLLDAFGLDHVRVASYQAVSGVGREGVEEFIEQAKTVLAAPDKKHNLRSASFPHQIAFNNIPQIGDFDDDGFCDEEIKIMKETRKILNLPDLHISAFTVRTPVLNAHSEAVWVTFSRDVRREDILRVLRPAGGIELLDEPMKNAYPVATTVSGQDPVFIGRLHKDPSQPKTWMMWIVSDNLRKGAALNGVQIAEQIFDLARAT